MLNNRVTLVRNFNVDLQGSQTYLNNYLIKQLPRPTVFLNSDLEVVHASNSWIKELDLVHYDIIGEKIHKLLPFFNQNLLLALESCLKEGKSLKRTEELNNNDTTTSCLEYSMTPWLDEHENCIGVILETTDISQDVLNELNHSKLKILLKEKSEIAKIGSWEYDAINNSLHWCPMTRKIHEVDDDFVPEIDEGIEFYKEGYSRNTVSMAVYNAMENGEPWSEKLQLVTAKGNELWVIAAGKPLFHKGNYVGLIGTFQDITDHVISENKIRESEHLLRTVVDNLPLNVYIKDMESRKVLVNKAECEYLGVKDKEELIGKSDFDLYDKEVAQISRDEDLFVINSGNPILARETTNTKKDGITTTFLTSKIPLYDDDGEPQGLLGISLDISNLKQKEVELRDLINVTSLQNKKLINFAHIVSHNLRSHTANFSMLLDFLVKEEDEEEKENIINMLIKASDGLLETLENLNEVVAISSNTNIRKKAVNLCKIIAAVEQNLAVILQQNRADIINEIPKTTTLNVVPAYMESILMNFITNAVKYKHPGRPPVIRISIAKNKKSTILSIEDNGMGIDLKKYGDKLFGMYKTFHDNEDARGIGLYITKNQIEAMNGKVIACSEVGKGTTFNIYFNEEN